MSAFANLLQEDEFRNMSPLHRRLRSRKAGVINGGWEKVDVRGSNIPCPRSLHAAAVCGDSLFVFGGYDGTSRVNDFFEYHFLSMTWIAVHVRGAAPSPRDRHVAVVWNESFYVFGGFDGANRVNDFYEFNFENNEWRIVPVISGSPPSARHSHAAVVHQNSLYVFGGYDGSYRNDFHEYDFSQCLWSPVLASGRAPKARYRATCCVLDSSMYLFGGHDGTRHLNDVHVFDFNANAWSTLNVEGSPPLARDSHIAVVFNQSMFVFGGSTGTAMDDFHELNIALRRWFPVLLSDQSTGVINDADSYNEAEQLLVQPGFRFCHVACVYEDSLYMFGGYDGSNRLNDFLRFRFSSSAPENDTPPSTLLAELRGLVNSALLSDITFIVEGVPVHAHKILCLRCPYFHAMLTGEMMESRLSEVVLPDVRHQIFLSLLEYVYTDTLDIQLDVAMELFQAADRFGIERLKRMCENLMLTSISNENAASLLYAADLHNAKNLRERSLVYILTHFDAVTKTSAFEEMGRTNVELVFEVLKRR